MGMLVGGRWQAEDNKYDSRDGRFKRQDSKFRSWIGKDPAFPVESGRYVLLGCYPCPWSHRTMIIRKLLGLETAIDLVMLDSIISEQGWRLAGDTPDFDTDPVYLHQYYSASKPDYTGLVTTPVLWDRKSRRIVSNESADIIRMAATEFSALGNNAYDLYPEAMRAGIDEIAGFIYERLNNAVYRAGFAADQAAYDEAVIDVFKSLDRLEERLGQQRWLCGDNPTLADVCALPTLIRFDIVYYPLFRCNLRRLQDMPNIWNYLMRIYRWPGVAGTCNADEYRRGYFSNMKRLNPSGIIPAGPLLELPAIADPD